MSLLYFVFLCIYGHIFYINTKTLIHGCVLKYISSVSRSILNAPTLLLFILARIFLSWSFIYAPVELFRRITIEKRLKISDIFCRGCRRRWMRKLSLFSAKGVSVLTLIGLIVQQFKRVRFVLILPLSNYTDIIRSDCVFLATKLTVFAVGKLKNTFLFAYKLKRNFNKTVISLKLVFYLSKDCLCNNF